MKIFFYPHHYLRDRHLDTIKQFHKIFGAGYDLLNQHIAENRKGAQVTAKKALKEGKAKFNFKKFLPLLNIKLRPKDAPKEAVIYVWGGLIASGRFIIDIDNPWALVGYNVKAMGLYKIIIRHILLSKRCEKILTMSEACREGLKEVFGQAVYDKAQCHYPFMESKAVSDTQLTKNEVVRFLFVGTQFEIKGGDALIKAFQKLYAKHQSCQLDLITHLPDAYHEMVQSCDGITYHPAKFTRQDIHEQFMSKSHVLVFPTYGESFGMVALEALAHSMAIITTDVYALSEMVEDGANGFVIKPPISVWDQYQPSQYFAAGDAYKSHVRQADTTELVEQLSKAMEHYLLDRENLNLARQQSAVIFQDRFAR